MSNENFQWSDKQVQQWTTYDENQWDGVIPGDITWGHITGVTEFYVETFAGNWSVDDNAQIDSTGNSETLTLKCDVASSESEPWFLGSKEGQIFYDKYQAGSGPPPDLIQYKTGLTEAGCEADTWHTYNGISFHCDGWLKIKVIKT